MLGFELKTFNYESPPLTTRPGLSPYKTSSCDADQMKRRKDRPSPFDFEHPELFLKCFVSRNVVAVVVVVVVGNGRIAPPPSSSSSSSLASLVDFSNLEKEDR